MAIIDILLPKMGESVAEATITKLVVDAGANRLVARFIDADGNEFDYYEIAR